MPRNLELKARYPDLGAARRALDQLGARPAGREVQTDTFFHAGDGRLKLREIEGGGAVLIGYRRPDSAGARLSEYRLVPVPEPGPLKDTLAESLGVRIVVRKVREVYLWENVRVHLDAVEGLGTFVEFEAVLSSAEEEAAAPARLDELCRMLGIAAADRVAGAYADLLAASG